MRVHVVQLEPLKERYTEWWEDYIPSTLIGLGISVNVINATPLTDNIQSGTVLDAAGTNYYKSQQIMKIAKMFHSGEVQPHDRFLVTDIWFPGVEAIKYMSDLMKIPVRIYGVWHAGSITEEDFMQPSHDWAKFFELGYLAICDGVFVGTDYSKESILERLLPYSIEHDAKQIEAKIHALGMPLNYKMLDKFIAPKQPRILFPNRFDIEKRPNIFMDAIELLVETQPVIFDGDIEIAFCTSRKELSGNQQWLTNRLNFLMRHVVKPGYWISVYPNLEKKSYYDLLAGSSCMVSTTIEENFGYCLVEALALGTQPIVPQAFSHPEILENHGEFMYDTIDELVEKLRGVVNLWNKGEQDKLDKLKPELKALASPYQETVSNWARAMS